MRKKLIIKFGILGLAAIFLLGMASYSTDQEATAQKPDKPGNSDNPNKGGHDTQDRPADVEFEDGYDLMYDEFGYLYEDGVLRVTCFIGRQAGQFVLETSFKTTSGRMLCLSWTPPRPPLLPPPCDFPFNGCRVARMVTGGFTERPYLPKGIDLRFMDNGEEAIVPLQIVFYNDSRKDLWSLTYKHPGVLVKALCDPGRDIDGDGINEPDTWHILTGQATENGPTGSPTATVVRNVGWNDKEECFTYDVSFHLKVTLQPE